MGVLAVDIPAIYMPAANVPVINILAVSEWEVPVDKN